MFVNCFDKTGSIGTPTAVNTSFRTFPFPDPYTASVILTLVGKDLVAKNGLSFDEYALALLFILSFLYVLQGWWSMSRLFLEIKGRYAS